ncbi:L-Ala-D/L-Glu epimerase [Vibrio albus]|jgi:L-alanine-DL-glutamate epimerase-like enolase superfamily enzyme|uniref:Dipeptide epimerase n=1 Tax=Vibrio albus TaxID=2200953 RepID=A0A2U3B9B7_9VIBR|nr:N-acetyl-D-Glu racemase DgcA [Vibrio albus]PWI33367.1 L-Ala-D/L-Glu epimerase [Vibrio albus]
MKVRIYANSWPIRGSFTISRGSKTEAEVVVVEIEENGVVGRGECVPYARYNESVASVLTQLEAVIPKLKENIPTRDDIQKWLPSGAARNALDCAFWDWECKASKTSIWDKVGISPKPLVTAYTLSLDTPDNMEKAAIDNASRPLLKLKLGGEEDLARVQAVRRGAPASKIILDANEAWTPELYQQLIPELVKLDVAMIEQPFPSDNDAVLAELEHPIPICADESCHDRKNLAKLAERYEMINIKIDKTGGLTEALAVKQEAEKLGLQVMVGCMLASSLSMAPAFVVAQGAEIVDLDGPLLLETDIDNGFEFSMNEMQPFSAGLWG